MHNLEKGLETAGAGPAGGSAAAIGLGVPMTVQEPKEKELPKEPAISGRSRSGTGKSTKEKKSMFGFVSGEWRLRQTEILGCVADWAIDLRRSSELGEEAHDIDPI